MDQICRINTRTIETLRIFWGYHLFKKSVRCANILEELYLREKVVKALPIPPEASPINFCLAETEIGYLHKNDTTHLFFRYYLPSIYLFLYIQRINNKCGIQPKVTNHHKYVLSNYFMSFDSMRVPFFFNTIERLDQGQLYPLGRRRDKHVTGGARTSAQ